MVFQIHDSHEDTRRCSSNCIDHFFDLRLRLEERGQFLFFMKKTAIFGIKWSLKTIQEAKSKK